MKLNPLPPPPAAAPTDALALLPEGAPTSWRKAVAKALESWTKACETYGAAVAELRSLADPGALPGSLAGAEILARQAAAVNAAAGAALESWQAQKRVAAVFRDVIPHAQEARAAAAAAAERSRNDIARAIRTADPLLSDNDLRQRLDSDVDLRAAREAAQHADSIASRCAAMANAPGHSPVVSWAKARLAVGAGE